MEDPDIAEWLMRNPGDAAVLSQGRPMSACVLLRRPGGKVLGVGRKNGAPGFSLPGGKADPGEGVRDAAARELLEETGMSVDRSSMRLVHVGICGGKYVAATFEAEAPGEPGCPEGVPVEWVDREVLERPPFGEYNRALFERLGSG